MRIPLLFAAIILAAGPVSAQEVTFTSNSTWTVPPGVTTISVEVVGAGGNGVANGRGGGGGGGYASGTFSVTPGTAYTITVGTAGSSIATSVSGLGIQATPGASAPFSTAATGGAGGVGSGGTINHTGGTGGTGTYTYFGGGGGGAAGPTSNGGNGGNTPPWAGICLQPGGASGTSGGAPGGAGGKGAGFIDGSCIAADPATAGGNYGAGGGGGNGNGSPATNGANGFVRITWCGSTAAPTGPATQSFCSIDDATVADLTATGTDIQWYTTETGGTPLASTTPLANGTYYASQIISGCESITRLEVNVEVATTPAPAGAAIQTFCSKDSATVADLLATGTGIQWYATETGTTPLTGSSLLMSGIFYASQTVAGCESTERLEVTADVTSVNTATSVSGNVITATATDAAYQWINCADNLPIAGATEASYTALSNGNYAVVVTQNGCSDTSACVAITGVGINAVTAGDAIQIYPNPASDVVTIKVNSTLIGTDYFVTDAAGRKVLSGRITAETTSLSVRQLATGVYHFSVAGQTGYTFKVVKR